MFTIIEKEKNRRGLVLHDVFDGDRIVAKDLSYDEAINLVGVQNLNEVYESNGKQVRVSKEERQKDFDWINSLG